MKELRFALHDLRIHGLCATPEIARVLTEILDYKGAVPTAEERRDTDLVLDLSCVGALPEIPDETMRIESMDVDEALPIAIHRDDEAYYIASPRLYARVEKGVRQVQVMMDPVLETPTQRLERAEFFYVLNLVLVLLLRYRHYFAMHTAALVHQGRGVLLSAHSGSGKTTATLHLLASGWHYVSDDTVLLRRTASGDVAALSYRRDISVLPDAAKIIPKLAEHTWPLPPGLRDKWRVDIEQVFPGRFETQVVPDLFIVPELTPDATQSRLEPMASHDAMAHLLHQAGLFLTPERGLAQQLMDILQGIVKQCVPYRLVAGPDLLEHPERTSELLLEALESTSEVHP